MTTEPSPNILVLPTVDVAVKTALGGFCHLLERSAADISGLSSPEAERIRAVVCVGSLTAADMDCLPNLELIASFGVGYDGIDTRHAAAKGIVVTNTPDVLTEEVADAAIGLLINVVRRLPRAEAWLRAGYWARGESFPPAPDFGAGIVKRGVVAAGPAR